MTEIQNLKIGDRFTLRKNGRVYEYLGYCPIENMPTAAAINTMVIEYYEENKKVYKL